MPDLCSALGASDACFSVCTELFPALIDEPEHPALHPDPALGDPEGQVLAERLRRDGQRSLIYPSVRHKGGRCLVTFDPLVIQDVQPGDIV